MQASRFDEPFGAISPGGEWLAYLSDESGTYECRVCSFTDPEGPATVVSRGASALRGASIGRPAWRRGGRELLYVAADERTLMTVSVTPADPPVFGEPQALFQLPKAVADVGAGPNLEKFLLCINDEEKERSAATVLLNFPKLIEGEQ